jgi:hypothetical protein
LTFSLDWNELQVADRGLKFVAAFGALLEDAQLPPLFREAWAFSACLALVIALARLAPGAATAAPSTPSSPLMTTISDARSGISASVG